jgi:hypothetical protein
LYLHLGGPAVAEGGRSGSQVLETAIFDLGSPGLMAVVVFEILLHLCNLDLTWVVVSVILNHSRAGVRLFLVVAGTEDRTVDPAHQHHRSVHEHSHPQNTHVHWVPAHALLCLVVVDLVGHVVDRASCRLRGVHSRKPHPVFHTRSPAVGDLLACNSAAHGLVNTLGRTVHVHSRCSRHCPRNIGRTADSCRIHSHRTRRGAGQVGRSPGRNADRSHRIAVADDSRRAVFAPEPAGAGRNVLDAELRRSWTGCKPCCQSNGGGKCVIAYLLRKGSIRRSALNGSTEGYTVEKQITRSKLTLRA